ncbi:MAG: RNA-binding protein [Candidatus Gracilibacteria bacterium]|nr:RNA-binding protein [Candidatus Gracilibacteria bacterium]MDD3119988.1 RNA-binding protein [Candidatus Gracilibacteria bacterium]MDD4530343.1 RNA-binding protein [Candidatus Gracilibacteria bacterium]
MDTATANNKLFIGGLPWELRGKDLREMFADFGEIVDATVILDRDTGRSKGFGFVTFVDVESATAALDAANGKEVDGRKIVVSYAQERKEGERKTFQKRY